MRKQPPPTAPDPAVVAAHACHRGAGFGSDCLPFTTDLTRHSMSHREDKLLATDPVPRCAMPAAVPLPRVFSRSPLDEATSCAAALIAIDVFRKGLSARQTQRLLGRHWDDDWYALMGVECVLHDNADALIDREPLRTQMQQRQRMLKAQGD